MKVRAYFVPAIELPSDLVEAVSTNLHCFAPNADPAPILEGIRRILAHDEGLRSLEPDPKAKALTRYAGRMRKRADELHELIEDMPPLLRDRIETGLHDNVTGDLLAIQDALVDLSARLRRVESAPAEGDARHTAGRFNQIAFELMHLLIDAGIEPNSGDGNPFRPIMEAMVQYIDPERDNPDVSRYIRKALETRNG